jgi:hypothetical protein
MDLGRIHKTGRMSKVEQHERDGELRDEAGGD